MLLVESPDGRHKAHWRGAGELWMSGPEWGYLQVDDHPEIEGASDRFLWSSGSEFIAVVVLYNQDVPTRQGAEGIGYRVAILQISTGLIRYALGNVSLADVSLISFSGSQVALMVNGEPRSIDVSIMGFPMRPENSLQRSDQSLCD